MWLDHNYISDLSVKVSEEYSALMCCSWASGGYVACDM